MPKCKTCSKAYKKEWAAKNKERINSYNTDYRKRADRKNYMKAYLKSHQESNRDYWNSKNSAHRAEKITRIPTWVDKESHWVMQEIYELAKLRSSVTGVLHHVDHILPLNGTVVSGLHVPENLQVIPWYENLSKSNKLEV